MRGWLVVNGFLRSGKFEEIYTYLGASAEAAGIELSVKRSDELAGVVGDGIKDGENPDFALFWDKDICLAHRLEAAGIRLFNSARAVEICDNKALTALALSGRVATPRTVIAPKTFHNIGYTDKTFIARAGEMLGFPMVIKEAYGSFGAQVHLARDLSEAENIVDTFDGRDFVMQEFIKESAGSDVRINVVGGRVVCAMKRQNDHDFRSNVTNGGKTTPFTPTPEQSAAAIAACEAIGLDFAGVDVLFGDDGEAIVCEVNSNPHFKSSLECTGVDISRDIIAHIKASLK